MKRVLVSVLQSAGAELEICVSEACDLNSLRADVARLAASLVFIGESTPFAENSAISQLLAIRPNMRVVVVSEETNWLQIFHREDRLLGSIPEFINLIKAF